MATPPESLQPLYVRVVGPARRGGLDERSFGELRTMRTDCEQAEAAVSFTRRMLHGRLDLLASEEQRRHATAPDEGEAGHAAADEGPAKDPATGPAKGLAADQLADLLEQLRTSLLGQRWPGRARARRALVTPTPDCVRDDLIQLVDDVAGPAVITDLGRQSDEQVAEVRRGLQRLERELSVLRRELHLAIDNLHGEVSRRYRRGEATVERLIE
jgi:hypothetical protein